MLDWSFLKLLFFDTALKFNIWIVTLTAITPNLNELGVLQSPHYLLFLESSNYDKTVRC